MADPSGVYVWDSGTDSWWSGDYQAGSTPVVPGGSLTVAANGLTWSDLGGILTVAGNGLTWSGPVTDNGDGTWTG